LLLVASWPVLWFDAHLAQTGALAAALAAGALALGGRFPVAAGVALGLLLALKPHYALPLLLASAAFRQGRLVAAAAITGLALCAISTVLWGPGIWPAAWAALAMPNETAPFMASWLGPASRLAPALAPRLAAPVFVLGIALVTAGILRARRLGWRWKTVGAGALGSLLLFSPNTHPYDLGLLLPALVASLGRRRGWVHVLVAALTWLLVRWCLPPPLRGGITALLATFALAWAIAVVRGVDPSRRSPPIGEPRRSFVKPGWVHPSP